MGERSLQAGFKKKCESMDMLGGRNLEVLVELNFWGAYTRKCRQKVKASSAWEEKEIQKSARESRGKGSSGKTEFSRPKTTKEKRCKQK